MIDDGWMEDAACAGHPDPDLWFPEHSPTRATKALEICRTCPVIDECSKAVRKLPRHSRYGIWGGQFWHGHATALPPAWERDRRLLSEEASRLLGVPVEEYRKVFGRNYKVALEVIKELTA